MQLTALLLNNYDLKIIGLDHLTSVQLDGSMVSRVDETEESWKLFDMLQEFFKSETRVFNITVSDGAFYDPYLKITIKADFVYALMRLLGGDIKLQVEISNTAVEIPDHSDGGDVFLSKEMPPQLQLGNYGELVSLTYEDRIKGFPRRWSLYKRHRDIAWLAKLKIKISGDFVLARGPPHSVPIRSSLTAVQQLEKIQEMMNGQIKMDTVILAKDGTEFQCHSEVLKAHSPVLKTELQGQSTEAQSKKIKMECLSIVGVKELLACLYYWDVKLTTVDFPVAMELLECAHIYAIEKLEADVKAVILSKAITDKWMDLSGAIRLFFFAKNVETLGDVKKRAIAAMKTNLVELLASPEYNSLLREEPDSFKILTDALLLSSR